MCRGKKVQTVIHTTTAKALDYLLYVIDLSISHLRLNDGQPFSDVTLAGCSRSPQQSNGIIYPQGAGALSYLEYVGWIASPTLASTSYPIQPILLNL